MVDMETMLSTGAPEFLKTAVVISDFQFVVVIALILIVKGFALWKAARLNEKAWFWAILIINSFGILSIIYLILRRNK